MLKKIFLLLACCVFVWSAGRSYYWLTDGFSVNNIVSHLPHDLQLDVSMDEQDQLLLPQIFSQSFHYLGKGCQSYVFASADGNYVLKFFKYQRYKTKPWLDWMCFIPFFENYRQQRMDHKTGKILSFLNSWATAYQYAKEETGLVCVHLDKAEVFDKPVVIYDKLGFKHELNVNQLEFMVQKKADMLCPYIDNLVVANKMDEAKHLLSQLVDTIVREYRNGIADRDHALMQNTGILNGHPIHIDIGQFVLEEEAKKPQEYCQALFNKTYKFLLWLNQHHPELQQHLEKEVRAIIGPSFDSMVPHFLNFDTG